MFCCGKCNACNYHHPYPGETSCRFFKDAKEKAKQAGKEDAWETFLDIETLVNLQAVELKNGVSESGAAKTGASDPAHMDQLDKLNKRMDDLTNQFKALLDLHSTPSLGAGIGVLSPPVTSISTVPVTSAVVTSLSMPAVTTAVTHTQVSVTPSVVTPSVSHMGYQPGLNPSYVSGRFIPSAVRQPTVTTVGTVPVSHVSSRFAATGGQQPPTADQLSTGPVGPHAGPYTPGPSHSPVSWFADPLTSALQHLSNVVDPDSSSRSAGMLYRPEFYALHKMGNIPTCQLDPKKMSYKQLLYGMVCVAQHIRANGADIDSYLGLCRI